ncbi:MAG: histidinol dehydrogenase [candidate division KSB1 bacterium]|nr:histidinol dehydrogenase [candidate division KSB1 bacterium]
MTFFELKHAEDLTSLQTIFAVDVEKNRQLEVDVQAIVQAVRDRGDAACIELTEKFDGVRIEPERLEITKKERRAAAKALPEKLVQALYTAAEHIETFHSTQMPSDFHVERPGVLLEERLLPIERVGVYIPGGRAKYPSTVLMTVIPARIAGVGEIIMVSPPDRETGRIDPSLLVAANIAGVDRIFRLGGAQAIAALAYGTETIPAVDKIVGPGNTYVAEAKRQVFGRVGIDMLAGPTELAIWLDETAPPDWVAQDMFAQMEHDPNTRILLVSTHRRALETIRRHCQDILPRLPRSEILQQSCARNTVFVHARTVELAAAAINAFAPEHLQLMLNEPRAALERIQHAGAVFVGHHTPTALGDYIAGPNHTLPTLGSARFSSALSVFDFLRRQHVVTYTPEALQKEGPLAVKMAEHEALFNHALSIAIRYEKRELE